MYLINISGEPREYGEGGFIYEFPTRATQATEVPDEIGEKLMTTGHYKEFKKEEKKEKKIKKEVSENGI